MANRFLALLLSLALWALPAGAADREYGDLHPRLLFDAEVLASLPDSIAADPVKADSWQTIQAAASAYLALTPLEILDSGSGLTEVPHLAIVAKLGDEPLASSCHTKLQDVADYLILNESADGGPDDLSTALRLRCLLLCYDTVYGDRDPTAIQLMLDEIREYLELMTVDYEFTRSVHNPYCSNHGISVGAALGLAEICLDEDWPGDPLLARSLSLGDSLIDKGLGDLLGADGSYAEGGLYLAYIHRMLVPYWDANMRLRDVQKWDGEKLRHLLEWVAYMMKPRGDGYFLNRNDCAESTRPLSLHNTLWEWSQATAPNPDFARWVQRFLTGEDGNDLGQFADKLAVLLWHRQGSEQAPQGLLDSQRLFEDSGCYVYRIGWPGDPLQESFLFTIQAGTFMGGHWQEDVGQFTLEAFGHKFAMDHGPGIPAKDTEGHNLPLVDQLGQHNAGSSIGTDGSLDLYLEDGFCRALLADMQPAYETHSPFNDADYPFPGTDWSWGYDGGNPLTKADRWVLLFPGPAGELPTIYLMDDLAKGGAMMDVEWRLHLKRTLTLSVTGTDYDFIGYNGRIAAKLIAPPPSETSWSEAIFDNGGFDENSRVLSVFHSAEEARFLWQMTPLFPQQAELPLVVEPLSGGIHATLGAAPGLRRDLFAAWTLPLQTPGMELNGRFGVIETEGGDYRGALIAGTEFRHEDQLRFSLSEAASASVDGTSVFLSAGDLEFQIYAPEATGVFAAGQPVPFVKIGNYVFGPPTTSAPADGSAADREPVWTLRAGPGTAGFAPLRLQVLGPGSSHGQITIYSPSGRRVLRLHDGFLPSGAAEFTWTGRDQSGRRLPAGLYLARLAVGDQTATAKLLLLR